MMISVFDLGKKKTIVAEGENADHQLSFLTMFSKAFFLPPIRHLSQTFFNLARTLKIVEKLTPGPAM